MSYTIMLKRCTHEQGLAFDGILAKDAILFVKPLEGQTRGGIKIGDGFSQYHDVPFTLELGEGPTTPDAYIGMAQMLAEAYKIRKELLCVRMD